MVLFCQGGDFVFQSTLPVGGATFAIRPSKYTVEVFQSTLPVGGATSCSMTASTRASNFNPRSPWGERRCRFDKGRENHEFQSTLPVGERHSETGSIVTTFLDFNPRSPWGERPATSLNARRFCYISIHAPRGGSDIVTSYARNSGYAISIHAPRGGSDANCRG